MEKPKKLFDLHRDIITQFYNENNFTAKHIVNYLGEELDFYVRFIPLTQYFKIPADTVISERSLKSKLQECDIRKNCKTEDNYDLCLRIIVCITHMDLEDEEILFILRSEV
jgi:hypothetical protein